MSKRWISVTLATAVWLTAGCQSKEDKLYEAVERLCELAKDHATTKDPYDWALEELSKERDRDDETVKRLWKMRNDISIKTRWSKLVEAMGGRSPSCDVVVKAWGKRAPTIELEEFQFLCGETKKVGAKTAIELFSRDPVDAATGAIWEKVKAASPNARWETLVEELKTRGHSFSCAPLERYWSP